MFQARTFTGAKDRSKGERFDMRATGGIYFDSVPSSGDLFVQFDEDGVLLPVRAGRFFDRAFKQIVLFHSLGAGSFSAFTYEENEGIRDMPQPSTSVVAGAAPGTSRLVHSQWSLQFPTGGTWTNHIWANPLGSGKTYVLDFLTSNQGSVSAATNDEYIWGTLARLAALALPINSANSQVVETMGFNDASTETQAPALQYWLAQPAAKIWVTDPLFGHTRGREAQANIFVEHEAPRGFRIPPGYFFDWSPNTGASSAFRARFSEV